MVKIITIPNDNDETMNAERARIIPWVNLHGWIYTGYNNQPDHIAQIRSLGAGGPLEVLEFDCHGNPIVFNHTYFSSAYAFARTLSQLTGFSENTLIFLSACNTGLKSSFGSSIAQRVADGANCTVYGTKGYMSGTYAENNEHCFVSIDDLPPYPEAQNESGRNAWIAFHPTGLSKYDKEEDVMSLSININASLNINDQNIALNNALENIIQGGLSVFPILRIAPDLTINYTTYNNEFLILDIFANGGLVKERISGRCWRVADVESLQIGIRQSTNY